MGPCVSEWVLVGPSGSEWVRVGPIGTKWVLVGPIGFYWNLVGPSGSKWVLVGPGGSAYLYSCSCFQYRSALRQHIAAPRISSGAFIGAQHQSSVSVSEYCLEAT